MTDLRMRKASVVCLAGAWILAAVAAAQENPRMGPPAKPDPEAVARATGRTKERFARLDRNKDGKLTRDEFPQQFRGLFDQIDANRDGVVEPHEDVAYNLARLKVQARPAGGGRGGRAAPTHADLKYGPHERNVLDLWQAKSDSPVPLVIYYHGGGFSGGDKRSVNPALLQKLLDAGVSVAAANYRLTNVAPFPAQMHDCALALQWLRHNAAKYNLDPKRVGATGGSAGAGISQWLAFHDDLADPKSKDPVRRQSTRLSVAVVYGAQTSYDPRVIQKMFDTKQIHPALIALFGMASPEDVSKAKFHPLFEESSPIHHATADDPPVMLFYPQANKPLPPGSSGNAHIHHPKFGAMLKAKLDKLGVECVVLLREDNPGGTPVDKYVAFFLKHLGVKAAGKDKE